MAQVRRWGAGIAGIILIVIATAFIALTFYGWITTEPSFESLNALAIVIAGGVEIIAAFLLKYAFKFPNAVNSQEARNVSPLIQNAIKDLEDTDSKKRKTGVDILASIDDSTAYKALALAANRLDTTPDVRIYAAFALARKSRYKDLRALPGLIEALRSTKREIGWQAKEILGKMNNITTSPLFIEAAKDRDVNVRQVVVSILAENSDPNTLTILLEALSDTDVEVRLNASIGLGKIRDVLAVPRLLKVLGSDTEVIVRSSAAKALGEIGHSSAVPKLIELLFRKKVTQIVMPKTEAIWQSFELHVQKEIADALESIGTPDALAAVEQWRRGQSGQQA